MQSEATEKKRVTKKPITRRKKKHPTVEVPPNLHHTCGLFYSVEPYSSKELEMLRLVSKFYTPEIIETSLIPLIRQRHIVSLRSLDWLVTNYAKKTYVTLYTATSNTVNNGTAAEIVMVYKDYNDWLDIYGRDYFDPFCRLIKKVHPRTGREYKGGLIYFFHNGEPYVTTIGQLMFIYWAICRSVLDYTEKHIDELNIDMKERIEEVKAQKKLDASTGKKRKRQELNKAPPIKCVIISRTTKTIFNNDNENYLPCVL